MLNSFLHGDFIYINDVNIKLKCIFLIYRIHLKKKKKCKNSDDYVLYIKLWSHQSYRCL